MAFFEGPSGGGSGDGGDGELGGSKGKAVEDPSTKGEKQGGKRSGSET